MSRIAGFHLRSSTPGSVPERVRLRLEDGSELDVPLEVVERLGLRNGDPVKDRVRAELAEADLHWRARDAALRLLSHRSRSRGELADRLSRKGFTATVVDACLDRLAGEGLVDDPAFARSFVRDRLRFRPRGRRGLLAELRRRGVAGPVAEAAVEEVFREEETDDGSLAVETALAWVRRQRAEVRRSLAATAHSPERERARRRLWGHLSRRGFNGGSVARAVDAAREAAGRKEG